MHVLILSNDVYDVVGVTRTAPCVLNPRGGLDAIFLQAQEQLFTDETPGDRLDQNSCFGFFCDDIASLKLD